MNDKIKISLILCMTFIIVILGITAGLLIGGYMEDIDPCTCGEFTVVIGAPEDYTCSQDENEIIRCRR